MAEVHSMGCHLSHIRLCTRNLWPHSKKSDPQAMVKALSGLGTSSVLVQGGSMIRGPSACLLGGAHTRLVTKKARIGSRLSSLRKPQGWRLEEHRALSEVRQQEGQEKQTQWGRPAKRCDTMMMWPQPPAQGENLLSLPLLGTETSLCPSLECSWLAPGRLPAGLVVNTEWQSSWGGNPG